MKEVEISIKGLFFYILKRWKSIIVVMLIGGVVLGGLQMVRSAGKTQTSISNEEAGASLSDSERAYVESVYDYLSELGQANEDRKESLIMNLDPENVIKTELIYMITVDDPGYMEGVEQAYKNYLNGSEFDGYISDKTGIDYADIAETVTLSYERSRDNALGTSIKIIVVSNEYSGAEGISKAVDSFLISKSSELTQIGFVHELIMIGENTSQGFNLDIQNRQIQFLQEMQTRAKAVVDTESALKGEQKDYYDSLSVNSELEKDGDSVGTVATPTKVAVRPSVKYIVLGLLVGTLVMCVIYFLVYIFANKLDVEDDVEGMFGAYLIGRIPGEDSQKLFYRLQNLGRRTFDFEESIRLISTRIKMNIRKAGVSKVGIVGCGIDKNNQKAAREFLKALKADGIEVELIDDPLYDPVSAEKLSSVERVVVLEKAGVTYRTEIWKEMEMFKKLGIKADGIVIAE